MFKNKKLIIFDLDGTLIDSAKSLAKALNFTLNSLGRTSFSEDIVRTWIGNGAQVLVKRALAGKKDFTEKEIDDELFKKGLDIFLDYYAQNLTKETTLYPKVKESLEKLKNSGYRLAIATNKPTKFIKPILEFFEIIELFELYLGGDSVSKKKPDPHMLIEVCKKADIDPNFVVMVGDSKNDSIAALRAGIDFIAVTYGYKDNADFLETEVTVDDFEKILDYFKVKDE